jgi:hypothetical protein
MPAASLGESSNVDSPLSDAHDLHPRQSAFISGFHFPFLVSRQSARFTYYLGAIRISFCLGFIDGKNITHGDEVSTDRRERLKQTDAPKLPTPMRLPCTYRITFPHLRRKPNS